MKAHASGKPALQQMKTQVKRTRSGSWTAAAALIVLSIFPLIFGVIRLTQLAGGAEITPENARFFDSPVPVVIHVAGAAVYALLGAIQFPTGFRRRMLAWHRAVGRFLVVCGLLVGFSALWMTLFYSRPPGTGDLLYALRLLFGSAMVLSIILGFVAIRRRNIIAHRAWMIRGYAIGLGAATQMLILMVREIIAGPPNELNHAMLMGAGWLINLAVAEWAIRKRPIARVRKPTNAVSRVQ